MSGITMGGFDELLAMRKFIGLLLINCRYLPEAKKAFLLGLAKLCWQWFKKG